MPRQHGLFAHFPDRDIHSLFSVLDIWVHVHILTSAHDALSLPFTHCVGPNHY
jgi:hypothetical protein